jgi:hypothetical protein
MQGMKREEITEQNRCVCWMSATRLDPTGKPVLDEDKKVVYDSGCTLFWIPVLISQLKDKLR